MLSDERARQVMDALRGPTTGFLSALATAADEVRSYLATHQTTLDGRVARLGAELGPFAAGRIDVERLAALFGPEKEAEPLAVEAIERALETLNDLLSRKESLFQVMVPEGGGLYETVAAALGEVGRAFAAGRVVQESRTGRPRLTAHGPHLDALPFSRWTRGERRMAPPLVVEVQGSDLRAATLSEFLDGRQKIVLVVHGDCAPAPLARLITPGTFVLQTEDAGGLERLLGWDGPAVAALLPGAAARFVHDPARGSAPWDRLEIISVPETPPRKAIGGLSPLQQGEELELLRSLATRPAGVAAAAAPVIAVAAAADPVDKLAAWLIGQADLSELR